MDIKKKKWHLDKMVEGNISTESRTEKKHWRKAQKSMNINTQLAMKLGERFFGWNIQCDKSNITTGFPHI